MGRKKIVRKSKLTSTINNEIYDSVKANIQADDRATRILDKANQCWNNLQEFREKRQRNKRYLYNNQWGDKVKVYNRQQDQDEWITEEEYIKRQGNIPLKNNMIRRLVRTVKGNYLSQMTEAVCIARDRDEQKIGEMMSNMLQCNNEVNEMRTLVSNQFEEFLISGMVCQKESYTWRQGQLDSWTELINPTRMFFTPGTEDPRHWDIDFIGCIFDISFPQLAKSFASNKADVEKLQIIYGFALRNNLWVKSEKSLTGDHIKDINFYQPADTGKCRVYEVWSIEQRPGYKCHDILNGEAYTCSEAYKRQIIDIENGKRIMEGIEAGIPEDDIAIIETEWCMEDYWYYRYITPNGFILQEGETPYEHGSHPFTIKMYPFIDGEAHPFVEDVIDQQRYINRLITMQDFIMRSSAKGVLMFPEELLPESMTMEDVADTWASYDGIIFYKAKPNVPMPQQIASNSTNIGIHDLLSLQMKLMEEISGVQGALQGKQANSGTAASLYAQQAQNAATMLVDLFEAFKSYYLAGSKKKVQTIQQYYTEKRIINIGGTSYKGVKEYDPTKVAGITFDLAMSEVSMSPVYRSMQNDLLMQLLQQGAINIKQMLECGNFPFADQLLQSISLSEQEMQEQQQAQGIDPELMQQVQQGANPQIQALLKNK